VRLTARPGTIRLGAVRVVIADDSLLVREGIVSLLRRAGFEVAAETSSADELLEAVDEHRPDVAIVDVRMPPTHTDEGLEAAREIRARHPQTAIVVLSQHVEVGIAMRMLV
jgi:DNA-binding NarL/FixJ family response regulator